MTPTTPTTPADAMFESAPLLPELPDAAVEVDEAEPDVLDPEAEPAPVPEVAAFVVPLAAAVVEVPLLPVEAPVVLAAVVEAPPEVALVSPFKQLVLVPLWMVTGADWAIWPLVSVS